MKNERPTAQNIAETSDEHPIYKENATGDSGSEIRGLKDFTPGTDNTGRVPAEHTSLENSEPPDTVNILDLFLVLVKYRMLIICFVLFSVFLGVNMSFNMTNIYRSDALIIPRKQDNSFSPYAAFGSLGGMMAGQLGIGASGSLSNMELALNSRDLTFRIVKKYGLMPIVFPKRMAEDEKKSDFLEDEKKAPRQLTVQDAHRVMSGSLSVMADIKTQTIRVSYVHENPGIAKRIVGYYITELSETLREDVLQEARENMGFFEEQIGRTADPLLKEKIYALLAKEIEKETFAKAQKYYSFQVLDPPIVADQDKRVLPNRKKIVILSFFVSFFMSVCGAFFIEFVIRARTKDAYRYREIVEGLKPRIWRRKVASKTTDRP